MEVTIGVYMGLLEGVVCGDPLPHRPRGTSKSSTRSSPKPGVERRHWVRSPQA